jgi:hypothetical protein
MYVYLETDPGTFTVGFFDPTPKFVPESDYASADEAIARMRWLNGAPPEAKAARKKAAETTAAPAKKP